ncbi:MAG: hypothetical protein WDA00_06435 [Eubacteriales bacterium]
MRREGRARRLYWLGMICCVVPPAGTALSYFPLWSTEASGRPLLSVFSLLLLLLCCLPFHRAIKTALKSPSAWMVWLFVLVLLLGVRHVLEGMTAVALVATPTSLVGALCFKASERAARQQADK